MTVEHMRQLVLLLENIEGLPSPEDVEQAAFVKQIQRLRRTGKLPRWATNVNTALQWGSSYLTIRGFHDYPRKDPKAPLNLRYYFKWELESTPWVRFLNINMDFDLAAYHYSAQPDYNTIIKADEQIQREFKPYIAQVLFDFDMIDSPQADLDIAINSMMAIGSNLATVNISGVGSTAIYHHVRAQFKAVGDVIVQAAEMQIGLSGS